MPDRRKAKDEAQRGGKHEVQKDVATGSVWRSGREKNRKLCLANGGEGLV